MSSVWSRYSYHENRIRPEQPVIAFASAAAFRNWLTRHHADHSGIWLKIAKKASGIPSVTYTEALDEALCFGWIDGQKKSFDARAYLQKFTPTRQTQRCKLGV